MGNHLDQPARFLLTVAPDTTAEWRSEVLRITTAKRNGGSATVAIPPTIRPAAELRGRLRPGMSRAKTLDTGPTLEHDTLVNRLPTAT